MTRRRWKWIALCTGLVLFLAALLVPQFQSGTLPRDIEIVEALHDPVAVVDWDEQGLWLEDGRHHVLPDVADIPLSSRSLEEATMRGIEITPEGRIIGLMRIHHWCGNSAVRLHIARVDLSHLLMFLREVELPAKYADLAELRGSYERHSFSVYGWNVSHFHGFWSWSNLTMLETRTIDSP